VHTRFLRRSAASAGEDLFRGSRFRLWPWLAHVQTAVQREVRSRREGRFIAGEPGDDRGDLRGLSETVHRNALDDRIEDLGAHRANMSVPMYPGETVFTVMPFVASSWASDIVKP
jgi:hypothetical protein